MPDYREQIISMAQSKPLLPSDVAKALNTNLLMASAMLSELSASKKLKASKLKVGSSPLYFLADKEAQLENYASSLNEKDRKTVEILKNASVLRDSAQDPLTRVSLRQIADFSKPVEVTNDGQKELFWKWYLLPDADAEKLIRQIIEPKEIKKEIVQEIVQETTQPAPVIQPASLQSPTTPSEKSITQSITQQEKSKSLKSPKTNFFSKISSFFEINKIKILETTELKKSAEYDFIIEIPSPVGSLTYYCKARSKKKITDADISNVFVQGQLKKLPVLLLAEGELNKQAKELMAQLKGVCLQKI